jgi:hypothetical protein|tara:strand:- start:314 stop:748 length:435 start_codon:yes stop_codon:yes gene_type:complete
MFEKNLKFAKILFTEIINETKNPKGAVIYKIEIGNKENSEYRFYIGKASKGIIRPMKHYPKFVNNYENNIYRKTYKNGEIVGERKSWRKKVHIPLSEARKKGMNIKLTMINVELENIDLIEQKMIKENVEKYGIEKTLNSVSLK